MYGVGGDGDGFGWLGMDGVMGLIVLRLPFAGCHSSSEDVLEVLEG